MASLVEYLKVYTEYNAWANEQIIEAITKLPDEEYYRPILPKSRAIHELLNHVLVMDKLWMAEIREEDLPITSGMQLLHEHRDGYIEDRRKTDRDLIALVKGFTEETLDTILYCDEPVDGMTEWPFMLEAAHVFRHHVHHRGQVTILLQNTAAGSVKLDALFVPPRFTGRPAAA